MKALEPILKFHFWILLGVSLILALVGWWMTTGQMQAATQTRRDDIKKAEDKVPKDQIPSKDWTEKLQAINADQRVLVDRTSEFLYALQKKRMVWPEVLTADLSKLKYRAEITDPILKTIYRDNYYKEVERVYAIPRPIDPRHDSGIVIFPFGTMPHREWGDVTPTSKQVWDSMEDLWLLEPILQAVYEANGDETAQRHDAIIVAIEHLSLKGGDRSKIGQAAETGGGGSGGGAAGGAMGAAMPAGLAGGAGGGAISDAKGGDYGGATGAGGGGSGFSIGTDIKDTEELGDPGTDSPSGGGDGGGGQAAGGALGAAVPPGMGDMKGGAGGGGNNNNPDAGRRYIDDDPAMPFRTRGFKLTIVMDHRKVPDLYSQLTSSERSPWPIQILRMHIARLSDSGSITGDASGGGRPDDGGLRGAGASALGAGALGGLPGGIARPGAGLGSSDEMQPGRGGAPSANDQLANPFLARVTVVGLITLYNEPKPSDSAAGSPAGTAPAPTADPGALPDTAAAGEPAAGDSAAEGDDEAMPAENAAGEPAEGDPASLSGSDDPEGTEPSVDDPAAQDDQPEMKPEGEDQPDESDPADEKTGADDPAADDPATNDPATEESDEPPAKRKSK